MKKWTRLAIVTPAIGLVVAAAVWTGTAGARTAPATLPANGTTLCHGWESSIAGPLARAAASPEQSGGVCISLGTPSALGDGSVRTFSVTYQHRPLSVGVVFPQSTLSHLPTVTTDGHHCYDLNGDGVTDPNSMTECMGGHERPLDLPQGLSDVSGMPLQWTLFNYNPHGHGPPGVYTFPHMDFHFYIQSKADRDAIRPGPCGILVNCDDFATARVPVPAADLPRDYSDVGGVEVAMGNHLVDLTSPEFNGQQFTRTFIYGAYAGKITFLEPMITVDYFQQVASGAIASGCFPIKQPQSWQQAGWYPQTYCVRYDRQIGFAVSLERFSYHS